MVKNILKKMTENPAAAFAYLASCPFVIIAVLFLNKILSMKNFTFGDDYQQLAWFHSGRIAYPFVKLLKSRITAGRFYPLYYQDFNIVSLLSSDLSFHNLAERCFYVQAGLWVLMSASFFVLMLYIAKSAKDKVSIWLYLFVPISFLTMLFTPAMVSYFLRLIFPETLLCVFLPAFMMFYYLGYKKDHSVCFFFAWLLATAALYCKENTFVVFTVICVTWLLFGWRFLTRKHKVFLFGLLASVGVFLVLYYFIAYRHTVSAYNQGRMAGALSTHLMKIFRMYPIYVLAFMLGVYRMVKVVFLKDRMHLLADAHLFAALGLFISFLVLKLVSWWYWGTGTIILFPVLFYWLIVCRKIWARISLFLLIVVCFTMNCRDVISRVIAGIDFAQKNDMAFVEQINRNKSSRRVWFCSFQNQSSGDKCSFVYLKQFLKYLGSKGRWQNNVLMTTEIPSQVVRNDIYVIRKGVGVPKDFTVKMTQNSFRCTGNCGAYAMYSYCPPTQFGLPCVVAPNSSDCRMSGCWAPEREGTGRWLCGKKSSIVLNVDVDDGRAVDFSIVGFPSLQGDAKDNAVECSVNGKFVQKLVFQRNTTCLKFHFPAGTMHWGMNSIDLSFRDARAPSEYGKKDSRKLTFFVKQLNFDIVSP